MGTRASLARLSQAPATPWELAPRTTHPTAILHHQQQNGSDCLSCRHRGILEPHSTERGKKIPQPTSSLSPRQHTHLHTHPPQQLMINLLVTWNRAFPLSCLTCVSAGSRAQDWSVDGPWYSQGNGDTLFQLQGLRRPTLANHGADFFFSS